MKLTKLIRIGSNQMSWSKITSVALCGVVLSSCSFIMYPAVGFFVGYVSTVPVSCNPVVQSRMRYLKTGIVCEHVVVDRNETGFVSLRLVSLQSPHSDIVCRNKSVLFCVVWTHLFLCCVVGCLWRRKQVTIILCVNCSSCLNYITGHKL